MEQDKMEQNKMELIEKGANIIKSLLQVSEPCLIGRFGTIECQSLFMKGYNSVLERNAGVYGDQEIWKKEYLESVKEADCLALGWYEPTKQLEQKILIGWKGQTIVLRSLEPYYVEPGKRWTNCLAGKKVCVVTSFASSSEEQVKKDGVWNEKESIWPSTTEWSFVQTGYAPSLAQGRGSWSDLGEIEGWSDAVDYCVKEVIKTHADIVLIGCGGLGMIIGARLKKTGKKCIVLGGAVQVLMGIKGNRWKTHNIISKFWNDQWVWPKEEETPAGASEVEAGCYWKS